MSRAFLPTCRWIMRQCVEHHIASSSSLLSKTNLLSSTKPCSQFSSQDGNERRRQIHHSKCIMFKVGSSVFKKKQQQVSMSLKEAQERNNKILKSKLKQKKPDEKVSSTPAVRSASKATKKPAQQVAGKQATPQQSEIGDPMVKKESEITETRLPKLNSAPTTTTTRTTTHDTMGTDPSVITTKNVSPKPNTIAATDAKTAKINQKNVRAAREIKSVSRADKENFFPSTLREDDEKLNASKDEESAKKDLSPANHREGLGPSTIQEAGVQPVDNTTDQSKSGIPNKETQPADKLTERHEAEILPTEKYDLTDLSAGGQAQVFPYDQSKKSVGISPQPTTPKQRKSIKELYTKAKVDSSEVKLEKTPQEQANLHKKNLSREEVKLESSPLLEPAELQPVSLYDQMTSSDEVDLQYKKASDELTNLTLSNPYDEKSTRNQAPSSPYDQKSSYESDNLQTSNLYGEMPSTVQSSGLYDSQPTDEQSHHQSSELHREKSSHEEANLQSSDLYNEQSPSEEGKKSSSRYLDLNVKKTNDSQKEPKLNDSRYKVTYKIFPTTKVE